MSKTFIEFSKSPKEKFVVNLDHLEIVRVHNWSYPQERVLVNGEEVSQKYEEIIMALTRAGVKINRSMV